MRTWTLILLAVWSADAQTTFRSEWPAGLSRPWAGADYWANPLQDWRISAGRLENIAAGGDRNVFLLTREIAGRDGLMEMSVTLGRLESDTQQIGPGFAGFRFGIRGAFNDYRDSAVRGDGVNAGLLTDGRLFIGSPSGDLPRINPPFQNITLKLSAQCRGALCELTLTASRGAETLQRLTRDGAPARWLPGGVALVSSSGKVDETPLPPEVLEGFGDRRGTQRGGTVRFWFKDWQVGGTMVDARPERAFGPILFAMHTLSHRVLKLTAQLAPVDEPGAEALLEIRDASGAWRPAAKSQVDPMARTATFRIAGWDDSRDTPYRVRYREAAFSGTIRKDPKTKPQIVVAAFTGNNDLGFPHADIVRNVKHHKPDLLYYTGDNIYERVGEYGIQRQPLEAATLDYLRKWYLFGWEYSELLKDIPAVCLPDDHDVYHGNLWGAGGRRSWGEGYEGQDRGGYVMPAEWVNMVQRTQTSHMPDPDDPAPVEQGITVYYGQLLYGGLSTAIIEDRKWKSAPKEMLPKAQIVNGWAQNPAYDAARDGDVPGAQLLGPRQESFLEKWAHDWKNGAWMKTVVSQTIFANLATLPRGSNTDAGTPKLRVMQPGEYAENETPVADHDSNGWPQTPRNRALRSMRKAMAFHIAGDQHLGSTIQYGIDEFNDAGWAICVPSVANVWPRRWYPEQEGANRLPGQPKNMGEFLDGFGNRMTVHAVSNPIANNIKPTAINHRAPGYGIINFDRATRRITIANWPRWVDATQPGARPYEGWPITIDQTQNGLPAKGFSLGRLAASGVSNPVVQVIQEATREIVYTFRIQGASFEPKVREKGAYTVRFFDPDGGTEKVYRGVNAR